MKKKEDNRSMDRSKAFCCMNGMENFSHLPLEIRIDILSRLPTESILQCRLVCKTWRNLVHDLSFAQMHLRRLEYHNAATGKVGFIFLRMNRGKQLYYVEYDGNGDQSYKMLTRINFNPPAGWIIGSCNGLICFSIAHQRSLYDPVYICNPMTRECMNLPRFNLTFKERTYLTEGMVSGFGYHHSTNKYKVVRIYYPGGKPFVGRVEVYTLGCDSEWRNKGEITYSFLFHHRYSPPILANGALHWLDGQKRIVAFDLADEEFRLVPSPPCLQLCHRNFRLTLFEGLLCIVHYKCGKSIDIWSFKKKSCEWECMFNMDVRPLNSKSRKWDRMFNIAHKRRQIGDYVPLALTKRGYVLLCFRHRVLCCYDPKTTTSDNLVNFNMDFHDLEDIPHMNSFVSLRALLGEDAKIIRSIEGTLEPESIT